MNKTIILIGLLVLVGCDYKPDLSDPWLRFCYNLQLDDFTYGCNWADKNKAYNTTGISNPIEVECQFESIQYEGSKYCPIEATKLGYSVIPDDYYDFESGIKHDGIDFPCRVATESLDESLQLCYDKIPEEFRGVKKDIKLRG